jgi:polyphosphate kinase
VKVQLLIRSICSLAAGVKGQSENITVHRIVDRYLEHARVFVFHNNGELLYFMGSADWMNRNLHSRIEVIFPVYDKKFGEELHHILELQLNDNTKAVLVTEALDNPRVVNDKEALSAQQATYDYVRSAGV